MTYSPISWFLTTMYKVQIHENGDLTFWTYQYHLISEVKRHGTRLFLGRVIRERTAGTGCCWKVFPHLVAWVRVGHGIPHVKGYNSTPYHGFVIQKNKCVKKKYKYTIQVQRYFFSTLNGGSTTLATLPPNGSCLRKRAIPKARKTIMAEKYRGTHWMRRERHRRKRGQTGW
jgi:hypothetical protein